MITIRPGSHVLRLLQLISTAGEIPISALSLLGSDRALMALVRKLETIQDVRFDKDGLVYHVKLLQMSGKRGHRTIRLYEKGLTVLDGLYPGLYDWYMAATGGQHFTGDPFRINRNHRVAEVLAACMAAGVEIRPYALPKLQKDIISKIVPDSPCFYIARDMKNISGEANKTMYTRITGALFYPGGVYAVYNTRGSVMKWSGVGEVKAAANLLELASMNAGLGKVGSAILFGQCADIALNTILESDKSRRRELRFDRVYNHIYFLPLYSNGIRLLKLLVLPDWNERLLTALFHNSQRSYNKGVMEYDAIIDNRIILSHLDGDIARLIRFREALYSHTGQADVLCFPWQTGYLKSYLGDLVQIRELGMDAVESALGG